MTDHAPRLLQLVDCYLIRKPEFSARILIFGMVLAVSPILNSCIHEQSSQDEILPVLAEDSATEGYRVLSYFNKGIGTEWKMVYGSGYLEPESNRFLQAPMAVRIIGTNNPSNSIEKNFQKPENVCGDANISFKFWAESQANLTNVQLFSLTLIGGKDLKDSATYAYQHQVRNSQLTDAGHWTRINQAIRAFNISSTFDCNSVKRIRIRLSALNGLEDTLILGELAVYPSPLAKAALIITEDDQWADFDTNAIPAMRKYGFKGTVYANAGLLGVYNKMNLGRLKTLQDSGGWTIGSHLWIHDSITALTDDSAERSLMMNAEFLRRNGFTGYQHFAYPYGRSDRAKDSIVRMHTKTARLTTGWPAGDVVPFSDPYRLRVLGFLGEGVSLEMAKGAVKLMVDNRTAGIIGVHQIVTGGSLNGRKWYKADWEALMDYIQTLVEQDKVKVYSLEEFLESSR